MAERRQPGIHAKREAKAAADDVLSKAGLKTCNVCGEVKSLEKDFHVRRASLDGRSFTCIECVKARCHSWREKNPTAFSEWHKQNKEHRASYWQKWYQNNKEHRSRSYSAWARQSPHILNAIIAKRRATKRNATPPWSDLDAIRTFYEEAARLTAETGVRHEVDHIYPLQGELVCGLHVPANLQILTKAENVRKGNRMPNIDTVTVPVAVASTR